MSYIIRLVQNLIFIGIGVFVMPIFYQKLGPAGLGTVSYVDSIATVFSIFAGYGIARYGTRAISANINNDVEKKSIYSSLRRFSLYNHVFINIVYVLFIIIYFDNNIANIIVLISFFSVNRNLFNIDWYFEAHQRFNLISIKNIAVKSIMVMLLLLALYSADFEGYYYFLTAGFPFVSFLLLYLYFFRDNRFNNDVKSKGVKQYYSELLPSLLLSNSYLLFFQADKILLGSTNLIEVGNYALAERIILLIFPVIMSLIIINIPKLTKLNISSKREYKSNLESTIAQVYLIVTPISFSIYYYSKDIVGFIGGSKFENTHSTLELFSIGLISMAIWRFLTSCVFFATSNEWSCFKIIIVGGFINVLVKFLYPFDTADEFLLFTFVIHVFVITALILYSKLILKIKYSLRLLSLVKYILFTATIIVAVDCLITDNIVNYHTFLVKISLTAVVYCAVLFLLKDKSLLKLIR